MLQASVTHGKIKKEKKIKRKCQRLVIRLCWKGVSTRNQKTLVENMRVESNIFIIGQACKVIIWGSFYIYSTQSMQRTQSPGGSGLCHVSAICVPSMILCDVECGSKLLPFEQPPHGAHHQCQPCADHCSCHKSQREWQTSWIWKRSGTCPCSQ